MASSMNLSLTDELREFVNSRTGDSSPYATPSEYLRDLIRRDMASREIVTHVMQGLDDLAIDSRHRGRRMTQAARTVRWLILVFRGHSDGAANQ